MTFLSPQRPTHLASSRNSRADFSYKTRYESEDSTSNTLAAAALSSMDSLDLDSRPYSPVNASINTFTYRENASDLRELRIRARSGNSYVQAYPIPPRPSSVRVHKALALVSRLLKMDSKGVYVAPASTVSYESWIEKDLTNDFKEVGALLARAISAKHL